VGHGKTAQKRSIRTGSSVRPCHHAAERAEETQEEADEEAKKGSEEMKRKGLFIFILTVVVGIVIVLTAKYFGLFQVRGLGGQVVSLVLSKG